ILNLPIPDFRELDTRIDDRLNEILHRTLARDINQRYPNADDLLYDLEYYIYHKGYGPTNETLGKFIRELCGESTHLDQHQKPHPPLEEASTVRLKTQKAQQDAK
ncbi:MAG: hypothetical protein ACXWBP_10890, partial [Limisphaerales bacterium]